MAQPAAKRSRTEIREAVFADQVISIDCGERTFRCTRRTWTLVESSVIGVAVSLVPPSKEATTLDHFFDEPPEAFALIVAHLRTGCANFVPPRCDRELEAYWTVAKKLGFARLAAHLELERLRREVEAEATYLDAQIRRTRECMDAWRRRTKTVDIKPLVVEGDEELLKVGQGMSEQDFRNLLDADDGDGVGYDRTFKVSAAVPLRTSNDDGDEAAPSTKVCVFLTSERALHDRLKELPSNYKFAARLMEDLTYRRLGLQRLLSRLPLELRKRSAAVSSTVCTRALYRDLYSFQGHELNESDRVEGVEFESPLYGQSGNPEGGDFQRLPGDLDGGNGAYHTWAYEYDGDDDAPWFDASAAERERHDAVTHLLADLAGSD